jgi:hypothetical protein
MFRTQVLSFASSLSSAAGSTRDQRWRLPVLCMLLALAAGGNLLLASRTPAVDAPQNDFVSLWQLTYLPYLAGCVLILTTRRSSSLKWQRVELGVILLGACLLRVPFLFLEPNLSHDAWRYLWDARVVLHGYSPYVHAPGDTQLAFLRDVLFARSRYRNVPTIYPPGAQYVYMLSYLGDPESLTFLKGIFLLFDLVSCLGLAKLLVDRKLDPARAFVYACCPLPVVEFALEGHMDVLPIAWMLLAALSAQRVSRRGRALTGFLLGVGTLAKFYPVLMLVVLVRLRTWRRDSLLLLVCALTVAVGYLPFSIQGHGQIFGFLDVYANEQGLNAGIVQQEVAQIAASARLSLESTLTLEHRVAFLLLVLTSAGVFVLRQIDAIRLEAGVLLLLGMVLAVSSHVFPWYVPTLLPWMVLLLPGPGHSVPGPLLVARLLALAAVWLFVFTCLLGYGGQWSTYDLLAYDSLIAALFLAAMIASQAVFLLVLQKRSHL